MTMLFGLDGTIAPPQEAAKALAAVSPRLGMFLIPFVGGAYWAITEAWGPNDPRRERVRTGEISELDARDIVHSFRGAVSTDDAVSWVREHYGERNRSETPMQDAAAVVDDLVKTNQSIKAGALEEFIHRGAERHQSETPHARRVQAGDETAHPMVAGFTHVSPVKRKKKKKKAKAT